MIFISLETSSLTHMLLRSVLFNLQPVWYFPAIFLLLTSSLIPLRSKSILCIISTLWSLLRYVLWCRMQSVFVQFHVNLKRMYTLLVLSNLAYKCQSHPADWRHCAARLYPRWFSVCRICCCWRDAEVSNHQIRFVCFSSPFCEFSPHVAWCSVVRHIHFKDRCVFLENWPLYWYKTPFCIPDNVPFSGVCSTWNWCSDSCFLCVSVFWPPKHLAEVCKVS